MGPRDEGGVAKDRHPPVLTERHARCLQIDDCLQKRLLRAPDHLSKLRRQKAFGIVAHLAYHLRTDAIGRD